MNLHDDTPVPAITPPTPTELEARNASLQARVNELDASLYHTGLERDRAREELQLTLLAVAMLREEHDQELAGLRLELETAKSAIRELVQQRDATQRQPLPSVVRLVDPPVDMVPGPRPPAEGCCPECGSPAPRHLLGCTLAPAAPADPEPSAGDAPIRMEVER